MSVPLKLSVRSLSSDEINRRIDELMDIDRSMPEAFGGKPTDYCEDLNAIRLLEFKLCDRTFSQRMYCMTLKRILGSEAIWDVVYASARCKAMAFLASTCAGHCIYADGGVCGFKDEIGEISDSYCATCKYKTVYDV